MLYVNYISNLERKTKKKHFELQKNKNRSNYGTVIKGAT